MEQSLRDGTRAQSPAAHGGTGVVLSPGDAQSKPLPASPPSAPALSPPLLPVLAPTAVPRLRGEGWAKVTSSPRQVLRSLRGASLGGYPEEVSGGRAWEELGARPAPSLGETGLCDGLSSPGLPGPLKTHSAGDSAALPPLPTTQTPPEGPQSPPDQVPLERDGFISGQAEGGVGCKSKHRCCGQ